MRAKKTETLRNTTGKKSIRTGRKAGESQLEGPIKIPDPPKPTTKA